MLCLARELLDQFALAGLPEMDLLKVMNWWFDGIRQATVAFCHTLAPHVNVAHDKQYKHVKV